MSNTERKIVMIVVIVVLTMSGCQPTPESEYVVGKDKSEVQKMVDAAADSNGTSEDIINSEPVLNDYEAPEKLQCIISEKHEDTGDIEVRVDADIIIPEYTLPMAKIIYQDMPFDNLQTLINMLSCDENMYYREFADRVKLKIDIEKQINSYNYELECTESESEKQLYKSKIAQLFKEYEIAPATYEEAEIEIDVPGENTRTVTDPNGNTFEVTEDGIRLLTVEMTKPFELNEATYSESQSLIIGLGAKIAPLLRLRGKKPKRLTAAYFEYPMVLYRKQTKDNTFERLCVKTVCPNWDEDTNPLITLEQTVEIAEPYVNAIAPDLQIVDIAFADTFDYSGDDIKQSRYGYSLYYSKKFNGIDMNFAQSETFNRETGGEYTHKDMMESAQVSVPYPPEMLKITVGPDGIIELDYQSPCAIIEYISYDVDILPFEEIEDKFKEYIRFNCADTGKVYMDINRIELSMMAIQQPDTEEYLVIPVWDFYGGAFLSSSTCNYTDEEYWNELILYNYGRSFLTINAINGSIIDRTNGF